MCAYVAAIPNPFIVQSVLVCRAPIKYTHSYII